MPEPVTIIATLLITGVAAATAITFWGKIRSWAEDSLLDWTRKNLPTKVHNLVSSAFSSLDNVATNIRQKIKESWRNLRPYLIDQIVEIKRKSTNTWIVEITSWLVSKLDKKEPKVTKLVTSEEKEWDELPSEIREKWLRNKTSKFKKNVTDIRDKEVEMIN